MESKELCPECETELIYQEGCAVCRVCGYSSCDFRAVEDEAITVKDNKETVQK